MRKPFLTLLSVLLASIHVFAAEPKAPAPPYELHEWGVFMVPRNAAWANMDMKGEWGSMPKEFYGLIPDRDLIYRGPVAKQVIYFHAEKPLHLKLTVTFAQGVPTVWWPAAESPANSGMAIEKTVTKLTFCPSLVSREKDQTPAGQVARKLEVPAGHWVETLRKVNASDVFCAGGWGHTGTSWDQEKFIYYDGLMKLPEVPGVDRQGERIILDVPGPEVWNDIMLVERTDGKIKVADSWHGWSEALEANAGRHEIFQMKDADEAGLKTLSKELTDRLVKAGLNQDEADAMVQVWYEGLFKQDDLTLFYRVPQTVYEKWLPIKAEPAPAKTARVGLVVHRHLEPELDARVEALIKQLGAEAFDTRDKAQTQLLKIGGAAFPLLEKNAKSDDTEIAKACQDILKALDARPFLGQKK